MVLKVYNIIKTLLKLYYYKLLKYLKWHAGFKLKEKKM